MKFAIVINDGINSNVGYMNVDKFTVLNQTADFEAIFNARLKNQPFRAVMTNSLPYSYVSNQGKLETNGLKALLVLAIEFLKFILLEAYFGQVTLFMIQLRYQANPQTLEQFFATDIKLNFLKFILLEAYLGQVTSFMIRLRYQENPQTLEQFFASDILLNAPMQ
uniref:Uncharacterized protein n=1 Tax=Anopheles coluzzii TaxID=1518534 RepID=A0A8W7PZ41_ANOCL